MSDDINGSRREFPEIDEKLRDVIAKANDLRWGVAAMHDELDKARTQLQASQERERVLREALEFYSLGIVWKHADFASASDAEYDSGRIARQALERAGRE